MARGEKDDLGRGIYVVSTESGFPCKIGVTNDLRQRIAFLQNGNWNRLRPAYFSFVITDEIKRGLNVWSAFKNGSEGLERQVINKMKELDLHMSGEWFSITVEDCKMVIEKVARDAKFRLVGPEVLQGIAHYDALPARQLSYIDALVRAEKSAQEAFRLLT